MINEENFCLIAVSVAEAAHRLSLGRTKVYQLLESGELRSRKSGRRRLVNVASIHAYMDAEYDK